MQLNVYEKNNSPIYGVGRKNLPPLQTINNDQNKEALAGAAAMMGLHSPPNNNSTSMNISQNSVIIKCYFHHEQNCILDYFNDPVLDGAVIYMNFIPFYYNKREGRYTEFICSPMLSFLKPQKGFMNTL